MPGFFGPRKVTEPGRYRDALGIETPPTKTNRLAIELAPYKCSSARIMLSSRLEYILKPNLMHSARISRFSGSIFEISYFSLSSRATSIKRR